ncbi:hypothetical protein PIB30_075159 [Stylosanthes scabra]|uniref:Uncharacterized protein n=1 Tax=Stylosanthes scabra TaxID=79078 RepID=A0ABU6TSV7_9FABA|nr:hypothetical protein [Stylosanthes scabra]
MSEIGNVAIKDVHQGLSGQIMEGTHSYDQRYTPWNPPPYQHHAPLYNAHQSNGFGDAYYGYEDPPPPYPPSQGNIEDILQVLLQEKKEIREAKKRIEAQLVILTELVTRLVTLFVSSNSNTSQPSNSENQEEREDALLHEEAVENFNHKEVHECLEEVDEENVDQEVADEDKESKGTEILQSASSEAIPPDSPSKLHFEWVNLSDMNLLGPQHYGLLETDGQLRALCGVSDKKEMDPLALDESSYITCSKSEFKAYSGHLHKLHNNRAEVGAESLRKHLGPWQFLKKLVGSQRNEWTNQVWDPRKSYKNQHFWRVIACIGAFRDLLNMNWDPIENTKFKHWWGFKDEFKHKPP